MKLASLERLRAYKDMSPQERGFLLNVLCKLERHRGGFFTDKQMTMPFTDEQIAMMLGWDIETWARFKLVLISGKILRERNGGVLCPLMTESDEAKVDPDLRSVSDWTVQVWNTKGIMRHTATQSLVCKVAGLIKRHGYTKHQIEDAIGNYAKVMSSPDTYFWSHRWSLVDFLSRGVDRFVSDAKPLDRFAKTRPNGGNGGRSIMAPKVVEDYNFDGI